MAGSKYCRRGYEVSYDRKLADKYQPVIYDPFGYGKENSPEVYFRILRENDSNEYIQYYYYWERQECSKDYRVAEPNAMSSIMGLLFAILGIIICKIIELWYTNIWTIPWWGYFLIFFVIGAIIGKTLINKINSIIVFRFLFGIILGRFFTHKYDFEPIIIYQNGSIKKIIISGKGDFESQSHRNDIFCSQSYLNEGKSEFYTADKPSYPIGRKSADAFFKEFNINDLETIQFKEKRPMFAIVTCYHVFTSSRDYYGQSVFTNELSLELKELTDAVLNDWYENRGFGHDISDPFSFPHIKYFGKPNLGRDKLLLILTAMSTIIDVFSRNREQLRSRRKLRKLY